MVLNSLVGRLLHAALLLSQGPRPPEHRSWM
jgi:hypothetical protein